MSDSVNVTVEILGPNDELESFKKRAMGEMPRYSDELTSSDDPEMRSWICQPLCFDSFLPVPEPLRRRTRWGYKEAKEASPDGPLSYGLDPATSGGAWEEANWGCKYGAICCSEGRIENGSLTYGFETRNALPFDAFIGISAQYPALDFNVYWEAEWAWEVYHLFVFRGGECVSQEVLGDDSYRAKVWVGNKLTLLPSWEDVRAEVNKSTTSDSTKLDL